MIEQQQQREQQAPRSLYLLLTEKGPADLNSHICIKLLSAQPFFADFHQPEPLHSLPLSQTPP